VGERRNAESEAETRPVGSLSKNTLAARAVFCLQASESFFESIRRARTRRYYIRVAFSHTNSLFKQPAFNL